MTATASRVSRSVRAAVRRLARLSAIAAFGVVLADLRADVAAQTGDAVARAGAVEVVNAYARATPSMAKMGAVYMTLRNSAATADRLVTLDVAADVARRAEVHETTMTGGVMKMRRRDDLELPAGASLAFAPGGLHVMLVGLARPLSAGDTVELTLTFEQAGELRVDAPVVAIGEAPPASHSHN